MIKSGRISLDMPAFSLSEFRAGLKSRRRRKNIIVREFFGVVDIRMWNRRRKFLPPE